MNAAILIGGKSRRMGRPKHLISTADSSFTWLERTITLLEPFSDKVVLVGAGEIPHSCSGFTRLPDIAGVRGPLAGILAAMRSAPDADWLIIACDMPAISAASVEWLLQGKASSAWGVVPRIDITYGFYEPLFALYKSAALALFEELLQKGETKISLVATSPQIDTPQIPVCLRRAWENINTPDELHIFMTEKDAE